MSLADQFAEILNEKRNCAPKDQTSHPTVSSMRSSFYAPQSPKMRSARKVVTDQPKQLSTPKDTSEKQTAARYNAIPKPKIPGQLCEVRLYLSPFISAFTSSY